VNSGASVALPSAGALYARKPIEEPQTDGAGDVKNHLADLNLDRTVWNCCRCHRVSFFWWEWENASINVYVGRFLDTHGSVCYANLVVECVNTRKNMSKHSKVFDIIVLAGMVVNIILAVFLILYYFDFL